MLNHKKQVDSKPSMLDLVCFCCGRQQSYDMSQDQLNANEYKMEPARHQVAHYRRVMLHEQDTPSGSLSSSHASAILDSASITASHARVEMMDAGHEGAEGGHMTEDEGGEDDVSVDMPPPMEQIQTHPLPSQSPPDDSDDPEQLHAKLSASLSLKSQSKSGSSNIDLAQEMENMIKNRSCDSQVNNATDDKPDGLDLEETTSPDDVNLEEEKESEPEMTEEEESRQKYGHKRKYVIEELEKTEKDYVHDLGLVVNGYMAEMKENPLPEGMEGKDKIVFGNIHQIYEWHLETFSEEIDKCEQNPVLISKLFTRYERRLHMYVTYCRNKPMSEYIVAEYIDYFTGLKEKLGHRLSLPDLLIKPVQRIMKYQLLLKDILKYTEKAGEDTKVIQRAVQVMHIVPKAANDMMNVGRLQGFPGKIGQQGALLLQDTLLVMEVRGTDKGKYCDRHVFLFEQILIVSEETERKKNSLTQPGYIFKHSIKANNMSLEERTVTDPHSFKLIDKTPASDLALIVQCPNDEVKQNWVSQIKSILHMLTDILSALQAPIAYQKELTKELSTVDYGDSTPKNAKLQKSYSQSAKKGKSKDQLSAKDEMLRKTSCPSSPVSDKAKESKKGAAAVDGSPKSVDGSPKPHKRTLLQGVRNPFRPKTKSTDVHKANNADGAAAAAAEGYASAPSIPDALQSADPWAVRQKNSAGNVSNQA